MRQARYYLVVVALWVCAGLAHAGMAGPVVAVLDGDTVDVLVDLKPVRVRLAEIEATAKAAGRGLWSEPEPVPPWEWRRRRP